MNNRNRHFSGGRGIAASDGRILRPSAFALAALAVLFSFAFSVLSVSAAGVLSNMEANGIDPSGRGSVTISINEDEWYVEGSTFHLYRVADLGEDLKFTFADDFSEAVQASSALTEVARDGARIEPYDDISNKEWQDASEALAGVITSKGIAATENANMRSRTCTFGKADGADTLTYGIYLVTGDTASEGNRTVTYQPQLLFVPTRTLAADQWTYDVSAYVKSADPEYIYTPTNTPAVTPAASPTVTSTHAGKTSSGTAHNAKTGDNTHIAVYLTVFAAAAVALAAALARRKRQ